MPHPASGEDVDVPDCADDAARYPDGSYSQPSPDYAPSDYEGCSIPDVAGEVRENS
jgi:hypothetical protein